MTDRNDRAGETQEPLRHKAQGTLRNRMITTRKPRDHGVSSPVTTLESRVPSAADRSIDDREPRKRR